MHEFWFLVLNENSTYCTKCAQIFHGTYTEFCVQCTGFCVPYTENSFAHTASSDDLNFDEQIVSLINWFELQHNKSKQLDPKLNYLKKFKQLDPK